MSRQRVSKKQESTESTSYQAGFPVNRTVLQENIKALLTSVTSGQSTGVSFAKFVQNGFLAKTCQGYSQVTIDGSLEEYSGTWPKWGTLLDGVCSEHVMLAPHIKEIDCLLWRTPQTCNASQGPKSKEFYEQCKKMGQSMITLTDQVRHNLGKMWPTPRAGRAGRVCKEYNKDRGADLEVTMAKVDPSTIGGQLNPDWVECLMGFPVGWTDLDGPQGSGQHRQHKK